MLEAIRRAWDAWRHPGEYVYQRAYRRWLETLRRHEDAS
jgi:hypothetical protein